LYPAAAAGCTTSLGVAASDMGAVEDLSDKPLKEDLSDAALGLATVHACSIIVIDMASARQ
jgi:hypothetical protein